MRIVKLLGQYHRPLGWLQPRAIPITSRGWLGLKQRFSSNSPGEESEPKEFMDYLDSLANYEKSGVPKNAGTDSEDGLDLGRMRRLLERLGNPHKKFKAVHIAGTKGKGSTAAFLSSILRAQGYSVGCYTSPHLLSMRERMTLGRSGGPVSAEALCSLFHWIKHKLDEAIQLENGHLTHFEVLTATAYALFAHENVDIAVIEAGLGGARDATNVICGSGLAASVITTIGEEHLLALGGSLESIALAKAGIIKHGRPLILGGPFLPHIERILRDKASAMCSPVVSACNAGVRTMVKGIDMLHGRPCQLSDLKIQVEVDFHLFLELSNLKLRMVGTHQLHNASTAACTALCLRNQGWRISDESIRAGLEQTSLLGRSQFLSSKEVEALGLSPGATLLLDGAHTKESAKALVETARMTFPEGHLALVVAMANDKDHSAFAREFLLGTRQLAAVFLTEVDIAGGKSRTMPASFLRECWLQNTKELGINTVHDGPDLFKALSRDQLVCHARELKDTVILIAENSLETCMRAADQILRGLTENQPSLTIVTGSLHVVSSVLAFQHS